MATISSLDTISAFNQAMGIQSRTSLEDGRRPAASGHQVELLRTSPGHLLPGGASAPLGEAPEASFQQAMLEALNGVNAMQMDSTNAIELMLTEPDAIDPHDVTIAMAKANMSLNITRTVLDRVVRAWRDLINTR